MRAAPPGRREAARDLRLGDGQLAASIAARRIKGRQHARAEAQPGEPDPRGVRTRMPLSAIDGYLAERADQLVVPGESRSTASRRSSCRPRSGRCSSASTAAIASARSRAAASAAAHALRARRAPARRAARRRPPAAGATRRCRRAPRRRRPQQPVGRRRRRCAPSSPRWRSACATRRLRRARRPAHRQRGRDPRRLRDLAKRTHPDRFVSASEAAAPHGRRGVRLVSAAYESIGDRDQPRRVPARRGRSPQARSRRSRRASARVRAELEFQKGEAALRARRFDVGARALPARPRHLSRRGRVPRRTRLRRSTSARRAIRPR